MQETLGDTFARLPKSYLGRKILFCQRIEGSFLKSFTRRNVSVIKQAPNISFSTAFCRFRDGIPLRLVGLNVCIALGICVSGEVPALVSIYDK